MTTIRKRLHKTVAALTSKADMETLEEIQQGLEEELEHVRQKQEEAAWASVAAMDDDQKARRIEAMSAFVAEELKPLYAVLKERGAPVPCDPQDEIRKLMSDRLAKKAT